VTTFVDTSALFPLVDEGEPNRRAALGWFSGSIRDAEELVTHNYVVIESAALVQRRLGKGAIRTLLRDVLPAIGIAFVDDQLHARATSAFLAAAGRRPSLVDWVSFEFMRTQGIAQAFAFDRDFAAQGFETVP
jgi:uncharacterized protein